MHSTQGVGRKKKLARCLKKWKLYFNPQKKTTTTIGYFLSMEHHLLVVEKSLFWAFPWWKMQSFLRQKFNGKMIFTDYWKVLEDVDSYCDIIFLNFQPWIHLWANLSWKSQSCYFAWKLTHTVSRGYLFLFWCY